MDQGNISFTAANNFVFVGDLFANNISTVNGGPTSFVYKPVFTQLSSPVVTTPAPSVSLAQPTPPVIPGGTANNNFIAPASITLTATATAATGSGNTISKVDFYQGNTLIGTASAPTTANGNNYSVTAKATDSQNNSTTSSPITVNVINNNPPVISLTASPQNATAPATIILNATASDSDGTVTKVEFFNGTTSIAVVTSAPYTTNWANVAAGSYSVTAVATDNLGATTTSAAIPVSVTANQPKVYDIHTDHIDTPRVITDANGNEVWRWDSAPFGETLPNEQPTQATGKFTFNLRFPGQYYDQETGLHYNYFRDYDPQAGRYVESDPLGLGGGINTYVYVNGRPFEDHDRFGLCPGCKYNSANQAATQAITDVGQRSVNENREYAGWIVRQSSDSYSYTDPYRGSRYNSNPGSRPSNAIGLYHTHGAYERPSDEDYSDTDKITSYSEKVPSYLGTPSGLVKKYVPPSTGQGAKKTDIGRWKPCE